MKIGLTMSSAIPASLERYGQFDRPLFSNHRGWVQPAHRAGAISNALRGRWLLGASLSAINALITVSGMFSPKGFAMPTSRQDQIEAFARDGCITIEAAVTGNQLVSMRTAFEGWVQESRSHAGPFGAMQDGRPRFDVEPGHCAEHPALRRVASPTELADTFLDVLTSSPLTEMAVDLIGPDLRLHHSKINSKLPGTATAVKWHQDFTFDPHSNDDLITCLIFLDDITQENGPLRVVPGSHRGPLYSLWHGGRFTGAIADEIVSDLDRHAVAQTGPAGSACIMHSRLAHASSANRSERARTLFIAAIAAADAVPLAANAVPSRHAGMLLAGREPGRIRATAFSIETPEVSDGASFFNQQADV